MGIARNKELYTDKWMDGLKGIPNLTHTGKITFWDKDSETVTYNETTNKYNVVFTPTKANVSCRIQPMRSAVQRFTAIDGTWTGHLLISMSYDDRFDISAGSRAKIVSASHNQSLLTKFLTVKEILDSDNSIEFTILCEVDTELHEQG